MTDEIEKDEEAALTAEYVLGLLSDEEAEAYEEVLAVQPSLRDEYAFWADRVVALTDDITEATPPPHILANLKEELFNVRDESFSKRGIFAGLGWMKRLGLLPAVAGGLLAAAVALFVIDLGGQPEPASPLYSAQIAAEDSSLVVLASYDAGTQSLTVNREQGAARDHRVLELWLIAGDNPPVSLGVLPDGAQATVAVDPTLVPALEGGVLAISDEPPGGSPTGAPTGDVLAVGPVTSA